MGIQCKQYRDEYFKYSQAQWDRQAEVFLVVPQHKHVCTQLCTHRHKLLKMCCLYIYMCLHFFQFFCLLIVPQCDQLIYQVVRTYVALSQYLLFWLFGYLHTKMLMVKTIISKQISRYPCQKQAKPHKNAVIIKAKISCIINKHEHLEKIPSDQH